MIKVLEHGNTHEQATCSCGCLFSYDKVDTYEEKVFQYGGYIKEIATYVKCPECDKAVEVNRETYPERQIYDTKTPIYYG